mmetsp:Transcript_87063/g.244170  ORF Transcript_87063/g.244170 Transcript_87063/m.244170 type:complete len:601 (-) Transcript_87063:53-1855(-)|eukprot:CAMPEP_0117527368 /NCGR_PEP_ID=MMETSP0784-20121206/36761_1 /TAXON_ID=39447 /ORGANISM="" /LENGTH=600 /DNA_ID=CAMNT_0005323617 /DNA_START=106 /DNA_END=1908 /DNA_ORIENTATION=-
MDAKRKPTGFDNGKGIHELHDPNSDIYVEPTMWCITRKDLKAFEDTVRRLWKQGLITDNKDRPNRYHNCPKIGPNMYRVNTEYIKPVTREAGGMSWALMRHPEGKGPCDIFATHAWFEGVFEFCSKVSRIWPRRAKYLYTCFLANPQNSDMTAILGGALEKSPFALALDTAKDMVVIPNISRSIYTRLWCVYEAHLAVLAVDTKHNFEIHMPWLVAPCQVAQQVIPATVLPIFGFMVSRDFIADNVASIFGPALWLLWTFAICSLLTHVAALQLRRCFDVEEVAMWMVSLCYVKLFTVGVAADLAWWHLESRGQPPSEHWTLADVGAIKALFSLQNIGIRFEQGEEHSCLLLAFCVIMSYYFTILSALIRAVLDKEAHELDFETVREAECTQEKDRRRIMAAIEDDVEDIDNAIKELRRLGKYNASIRQMLECGLSHNRLREGIRPMQVIAAVCSWEFWWITDLDGRGFMFRAIALFVCSCVIALIIAYKVGDRAIFAIESAMWFGVAFALASNHRTFFTRAAVVQMNMTGATLWLQLSLLILNIAVDVFFYSGGWAVVTQKFSRFCKSTSREQIRFPSRSDEESWDSSVYSCSGGEGSD